MNIPIGFPTSNFAAAALLSASLIVSSLILDHKPPPPGSGPLAAPALLKVAPPISQEAIKQQFREQLLAAQTLHTYQHNHKTFTLTDIKVKQVIYTAKDDDFSVEFEWIWREGSPLGKPWSDGVTLYNDGYGHYYGPVVLSPIMNGTGQNADVTIG